MLIQKQMIYKTMGCLTNRKKGEESIKSVDHRNSVTHLRVAKWELGQDQLTRVWVQVLYTLDTQVA